MIASKKEEIVRVFDLVSQNQTNSLQRSFPPTK